ncbi:MAG: hypothetical protein ACR2GK_00535, partial [Gemmatimonadaceae bacterium]
GASADRAIRGDAAVACLRAQYLREAQRAGGSRSYAPPGKRAGRDLARKLEPRSPTPEARVRALSRLREAGIDAGINCMPVLPGITDNPNDLDGLVKRVSEAGATYAGACALILRSTARKRYLPFIAQEFPHLEERYRNHLRARSSGR